MSENTETNPFAGSSEELEAFQLELFGKNAPVVVGEESAPVEETVEEEPLLEDEDTGNDEDDAPAPEEPKKKSRFQERIDQLSEKARLERERADTLEARLKKLEEGVKTPEPASPPTKQGGEPTVDDVDEKGDPKYPLGEFDPNFAKDMVKYAIAEQLKQQQEQDTVEARQRAEQAEIETLNAEWNAQVETALERYPDYRDKGADLLNSIEGVIEPAYGEYLAHTIQQLDNGPDVFYHLASNPEEALAIIQLPASKATIALGRLDAMFASETSTKSVTPKAKTSNAPPPPPTNRGASVAVSVSPDTEDLAAFKAQFFKPNGQRR